MKYPDTIALYRGVSKEEADIFYKTGRIPASKRYGGVSHWTTDKNRAKRYDDIVLEIHVEVDERISEMTNSPIYYPELKNRRFRKVGGTDYVLTV